jgi:two-component system NarL family sensor kinase
LAEPLRIAAPGLAGFRHPRVKEERSPLPVESEMARYDHIYRTRPLALRTKLALISLGPVLLVAAIMGWVFTSQSQSLLEAETDTVRAEFVESKRQELKNYALLALNSVREIYESEPGGRQIAQLQVKQLLNDMEYGEDGYFFVYEENGTNIVHPRLKSIVGKNLIDMQDANGDFVIRNLISKAKASPEGDFHNYVWPKPSTGEITEKLGYSIYLPKWGWMFGTGLYLDDINDQLVAISTQIDSNIKSTSTILFAVTAVAVLAVILLLLSFRVSEQKLADARLKALTRRVVDVQEEERKRVSQELHDGISQLLVSVRYTLDSAAAKSKGQESVSPLVNKAGSVLDDAISEIRRISKDLRPSVLDDIGLVSAARTLAEEFSKTTGIAVSVEADPQPPRSAWLPEEARTALYRVLQEALTNVARHSNATKAAVTLRISKRQVTLQIADNGKGFNARPQIDDDRSAVGLGLRNMRERVELHGGLLFVRSRIRSEQGAEDSDQDWTTEVMVRMPRQNFEQVSLEAAE